MTNNSETVNSIDIHTPPYKMPPQPIKNMTSVYNDAQIPGTALINELHMNSNMSLRTHSSKFPVIIFGSFLWKKKIYQIFCH